MLVQETLRVISTFLDRYMRMVNEQGDYSEIYTIDGKVCFVFSRNGNGADCNGDNDYRLYAWIEGCELKIENENGESVFDYAKEYGWGDFEVYFARFGYEQVAEVIRERGKIPKGRVIEAAKDIVDRCFTATGVPKTYDEVVAYVSGYLCR